MDPTKLIIEHPFSIEERFKRADLEKMMSKKGDDAICFNTLHFAYKEGGIVYVILCSKSVDVQNGKIGINLNVTRGNVDKIKAKYRISLPSINFSTNFECVFKLFTGLGMGVNENMYFQPGFFVNDELHVKIDGTLIFERPLISTCSYPINIRWNIKEFELKAKAATNGYLKTSKYNISPNSSSKYFIEIFPNGCNEATREKVLTLLHLELGNEKKIEANNTFSSGNLTIKNFNIYDSDEGQGPAFCSTGDLFHPSNGIFVNGEMSLKVNGNLILKKEEPSFKLSGIGIKGFKNEKDFKIVVDGKEIPVHKSLLIESSQYFSWTLKSRSKELTKNEVILTGFSFKTVDAAIKLLYGLSPTFSLPDLIPLLYFSDKYVIANIKVLIEKHLIKNIHESTVCQLIHFSTVFHASKLRQRSIQFLLQCLRKSSPVNDLDLLDKDLSHQFLAETFGQTCETNCD